MRFSSHLSRYLTPEWKRHYIDYEGLKKEVYLMVGKREPVEDEGEEREGVSEGKFVFVGEQGQILHQQLSW